MAKQFNHNLNHRRKTMRTITTKAIALLIAFSTATLAQEKGSFTDTRDKKKYKTVKIGTQTWMAENLNYNPNRASGCYDNKPANCTKYGRIYYGSFEPNEICPNGWHLPSNWEWQTLVDFAGGKEAGKNLKAKSGWNKGNGTDKFGFAALPGGEAPLDESEGAFSNIGKLGCWKKNDYDRGFAIEENNDINFVCGEGYVRCVQGDAEEAAKLDAEAKAKAEAEVKAKDDAAKKAKADALEAIRKAHGGSTFTDARDKKVYITVKIGDQTWMAQNLDYADKDSKCYDNFEDNCKKYGRLYSWATALKACPVSWHLPSDIEWKKLMDFADDKNAINAAKKLKTISGWSDLKGNSSNGTEDYGFSALPGGYYRSNPGEFLGFMKEGRWWSSEDLDQVNDATYQSISQNSMGQYIQGKKTDLLSIRCVQGDASAAKQAGKPAAKQAEQPKKAEQPKQQSPNENCSITFPKKSCISMPTGTCKMAGGKVVDKCP
jgi:uncharacterized protein (TIGR02145 family)